MTETGRIQTSGSLSDEVLPVRNRYMEISTVHDLPVFATRDWPPEHHCAFSEQVGAGGITQKGIVE